MNLPRRTALLGLADQLGLASAARYAWRWPSRRADREALRRGDPARRAGWDGRGGALRRSRPGRPARRAGAAGARPARRVARSRRLLRPAPGAGRTCTHMYKANELLAVHAVAGTYRVRSHFEAQDYLESGADHRMTSGWLNRAVAALPPATAQPAARARRSRSACRCRCCCAGRRRSRTGRRTAFAAARAGPVCDRSPR